MNFVPLHVYSGYSYLKSGLKLEEYFKKAIKLNYTALALTDFNTFSSSPRFVSLAKKNKIKPIIGLDLNIEENLITFIVKNEEGYRNLLHFSYLYQKNELSYEYINSNNNGLIIVFSSNNPIFKDIDNPHFSHDFIKICKGIKDFYIGLDKNDSIYMDKIRAFSDKYNYGLVAFPFIKYLNKEDAITLKMLEVVENKNILKDKVFSGEQYLSSIEELKTFYKEEEINKSNEIAQMINFEFIVKRGKILKFSSNSPLMLKTLTYQKLKQLNLEKEPYISRLEKELNVIIDMGYSDYFLIVKDYVDFARNNDIIVGPGRGSAVGSLVSYLLDITKLDPIKYGLIFERFLNKERQTLPDIDIDFEDDKRDYVASYLASKYGKNRVAKVMAIQKFGAKQALGDVGRIYNYPRRDIELFTKLISKDEEKLSLREIYKKNKRFRDLVNEDKYYLEIVSLANRLEGLPRQEGMHPAGVLINDEPLENVAPLYIDNDGSYLEQFEKDYLEEQSFLKMDLLSLRNLTIIKDCLNRLKTSKNIDLKFDDIPYEEDINALKIIRSGNTMGLFQLESSGMRKSIAILKPSSFVDVAALLALYRPGPLQNIEEYALRKEGKKKIVYASQILKKILKETYGIIVYQEQIMRIAHEMASFSLAEADLLRRAISKKNSSLLANYEKQFILGAKKNGYSEKEAKEVYDTIYKFGDYGFNKSHAMGYAMLTMKMAYLKANYPKEFFASILNYSNSENFHTTISEIKALNIKVKNPDINISTSSFLVKDDALIFPFTSIKGISSSTATALIKEREEKPFSDFFDFVLRVQKYKINSKQIIALIDAGCFDNIEPSRATLRQNIPGALNYASMVGNNEGEMIIDVSMFPKPTLIKAEDNILYNLNQEFDVLGLMLSSSPIKIATKKLNNLKLTSLANLASSKGNVKVVAIFKEIKRINTKKGEPMAFANIYDDSKDLEITIFPLVYEKCYEAINKNNMVLIDGYYSYKNQEFVINDITSLEDINNG